MKLRLWVKCLLIVLGILIIILLVKWNQKEYDKCMKYTNGNISICEKVKD